MMLNKIWYRVDILFQDVWILKQDKWDNADDIELFWWMQVNVLVMNGWNDTVLSVDIEEMMSLKWMMFNKVWYRVEILFQDV